METVGRRATLRVWPMRRAWTIVLFGLGLTACSERTQDGVEVVPLTPWAIQAGSGEILNSESVGQ